MDIRIGILNSPRELAFETNDSVAEIEAAVSAAVEKGTPLLALSDDKGKRYLVPTAAIGYVEIGSESTRRVGFVG